MTASRGEAAFDPATDGILAPRIVAWLFDAVIIAAVTALICVAFAIAGLFTFGLGWLLFGLIPAIPILYNVLSLASPHAATPGQRLLGLRMHHDGAPRGPTPLEALISTLLFYVTLGVVPLWLVPVFSARHRTLHDLAAGLVLVRTTPLTTRLGAWNMGLRRAA